MTSEPPFDCADDIERDWPAPAEQRTALAPARPRGRFCRRHWEG